MFSFNPPKAFLESNGSRIGLDCRSSTAFVSHAHADHLPPLNAKSRILASKETIDLIKAIKSNGFETLDARELNAQLLNAGHVLGSRQLRVESDGKTFTYAGDFCLSDSLLFKGAETKQSDEILIEATYGSPEYVFPERTLVYEEIAAWVENEERRGKNIVLGGYCLGKA
ncbi:MAG: hypothetical protein V1834_01010, partial [Candidatus Micrarchaeota archaeon]